MKLPLAAIWKKYKLVLLVAAVGVVLMLLPGGKQTQSAQAEVISKAVITKGEYRCTSRALMMEKTEATPAAKMPVSRPRSLNWMIMTPAATPAASHHSLGCAGCHGSQRNVQRISQPAHSATKPICKPEILTK